MLAPIRAATIQTSSSDPTAADPALPDGYMRIKRLPCHHRGLITFVTVGLIVTVTSVHLIGFLKQHNILIPEAESLTKSQIKDMIKQAEKDNIIRLRRIQKVCSKYNLGLYKDSTVPSLFKHPPTPQYSVFYIDLVHKLSWCPIYKAASSTWLYNLCLLGGFTEAQLSDRTQQLSTLARKIYPELDYPQAEDALQSTVKILVVRHPFERLLSAYRDKLENTQTGSEHGTHHFYSAYGARIVSKYRPGGNQTKTHQLLKPGTYYWDSNKPKPSGIEPTFKEFVRYLIDLDLLSYADDHWIPYYLFCTPCLLNYNIIGKVETMHRDQIFAIHSANLQQIIKPRWQHRTAPVTHNMASNMARIYFAQLTRSETEKLYQKYQLDFELFDYDIKEYLKYTLDNKNY